MTLPAVAGAMEASTSRGGAAPDDGGDAEAFAEQTLFTASEVYAYQVPPLRSLEGGYAANDWGLNKWFWSGSCRVVLRGERCSVRLEVGAGEQTGTIQLPAGTPVPAEGDLFAECLVRGLPNAENPEVESVRDSSRYFVLRIEHEGRVARLGLGFRERTDASEFLLALDEYWRYLRQKAEAARRQAEASRTPPVDRSLGPPGTSVHLRLDPRVLGGGDDVDGRRRQSGGNPLGLTGGAGGGSPLQPYASPLKLQGPPGAARPAPAAGPAPGKSEPTATADYDDDDFGDFV